MESYYWFTLGANKSVGSSFCHLERCFPPKVRKVKKIDLKSVSFLDIKTQIQFTFKKRNVFATQICLSLTCLPITAGNLHLTHFCFLFSHIRAYTTNFIHASKSLTTLWQQFPVSQLSNTAQPVHISYFLMAYFIVYFRVSR